MTLCVQEKVEILETHGREVRAVTFTFKLPSVVRLLRFVKLRKRPVVQFTRANIYARDNFTCQYCDERFEPEDLTFDHVIPVAQGGTRGWENIVTSCEPCNRKKGARTPEEAGITLRRPPRRPLIVPHTMRLTIGYRTPANWQSYLYWHITLDEQ